MTGREPPPPYPHVGKPADFTNALTRSIRAFALGFSLFLAADGSRRLNAQTEAAPSVDELRHRATNGDAEAQNALGNAFTNGTLGLQTDLSEALAWYQRAAEKRYPPALFNIGLAYELGRGVPINETAAFNFYQQAAEMGFAIAQFNLGNMYSTGRGVAQDLFEANLWYRQAAAKGIVPAQFNLGLAYESGRGVRADATQAAHWYRQAAEKGFPLAAHSLASLLEGGRGVPKDEVAAARYYEFAARQGYGPAQNNYGVMLYEGRGGLAPDPVQALFWLTRASENGVDPKARNAVASTLSPEQIAAAESMLAHSKQSSVAEPQAAPSSPAQASPPKPVLEQAVVEASGSPRAVEELREQVTRLAEQVMSLISEKNALEEKLAADVNASAAEELAGAQQNIARLTAYIRRAETEILKLQDEAKSAANRAGPMPEEAARQIQQLSHRIQELEQQRDDARLAASRAPETDSETAVGRLQQQVKSLFRENAELNKWVGTLERFVKSTPRPVEASEAAATWRKLGETEEMLTAMNSALQRQSRQEEKLKFDHSMLEYRAQRAEETLATERTNAAREHQSLKHALAEATQRAESLEIARREDQQELARARERANNLERELQRVPLDLPTVRTDAGHLRLQLAQVTAERDRLQLDLATAKEDAALPGRELAALQLKIAEREASLAAATSHARSLEEKLARAQERNDAFVAAQTTLAAANESLQRENRQLIARRGTTAAPDQGEAADTVRLRQEVARLLAEQEAEQREHDTLVANLRTEKDSLAGRLARAQRMIDQIVQNVREDLAPSQTISATTFSDAASAGTVPREHLVRDGDSLTRLSQQYYGTVTRWQDIYRANDALLRETRTLRAGQKLKIP